MQFLAKILIFLKAKRMQISYYADLKKETEGQKKGVFFAFSPPKCDAA